MGCVLAGIIAWFDYKLYGELSIFFICALAYNAFWLLYCSEQTNYGQKRLEITDSIEVSAPPRCPKIALIVTLAWDLSQERAGHTEKSVSWYSF